MSRVFILALILSGCSVQSDHSNKNLHNYDAEMVQPDTTKSPLFKLQEQAKKTVIESYKREVQLDTVLEISDNRIEVSFRHYCTFDSVLLIPRDYYEIDKAFATHNFISDIKIHNGETIVYDSIIRKKYFGSIMTAELTKYAVLTRPYFGGYDKKTRELRFHYSATIPATDIGSGVNLYINLDGTSRVSIK